MVNLCWKTGKKENLSEMEQQLKKTEAAQRRKVQIEKAARESEVGVRPSPSCYVHYNTILVNPKCEGTSWFCLYRQRP